MTNFHLEKISEFCSSLVLRDFTLRSAASFGQFHLIRLLFDDYLSIAVERRLAQLNGQPAIALMAPEAIPTFLRPSPFALPMQPQQQHVTVPNTVPLYCSHPPPPTTVSMYAVVPANFPLPLPTTTTSSSSAIMAQQQPFFGGHHRPQSFHQNSPLHPFVDPLPPPGPEPPLDMLNGSEEAANASGDCRGGSGNGAIRYVGAGDCAAGDGGGRRRIKQEQDETVDEHEQCEMNG
uniref:LOB domain-containing protein n=1 Tax=Globodera pallida TaxID=36090 RepID=A0A183CJU2_GLOPA